MKIKDFGDKVKVWWEATNTSGKANFRVAYKLNCTKLEIKKWRREEGIIHEMETKLLLEEIEEIYRGEGEGVSTTADIAQRESLKIEVATIIQMEEIS